MRKPPVPRRRDRAVVVPASEPTSPAECQDDLDAADEVAGEGMGHGAPSAPGPLPDPPHTPRNRRTVSRVFYVSMPLLILFSSPWWG